MKRDLIKTLRSLMSAPKIIFGGSIIIASVLTWHFSGQNSRSRNLKSSNMASTARRVLITGATRGIGLQFVKEMSKLSPPPELLIAACRDPHSATELQDLAKTNPSIKVIKLDVEKDEDIDSAYKEVKTLLGGKGLNLLINNAGIYEQTDDGKLIHQTRARLQRHFDVNASGPILVTQKFLPLLIEAVSKNKDAPFSCTRAGVIMMTSYMGSQTITHADGAGVAIHYKASKSALNMAAVAIARELKEQGIFVAALHPGWVKTDMGGQEAMFTPEESVQGCLKVISSASEDQTGKLITFEGKELPY